MIYGVIFILMTHLIVARGVDKGIEKASRIMMPALFVILIVMAVRVAFMPGAAEGYKFIFSCDFSKAFQSDTIMMAIGQAFFSLSVGMGCMVTYASYFKKDNNMVSTSFNVSLLTLVVSVLASLVIFPAATSAGMDMASDEVSTSPSFVFVTLPEIFKDMPLAPLWSSIFFLLVIFASLTSTISFHEVLTAYTAEEFKLSRKGGALVTSAVSIVLKEALYRYTVIKGKKLDSKAVIANAWHHRSDAFSSIGTLIGIAGAIFLGEKWRVLDPIAAFIVSVFIIKVAVDLIKPCIDELLEKSLSKEVEERILTIVTAFPEVDSPHHLRTRRIGNNIAIEIHIRMDGAMSLTDAHDITKKIESAVKEEFGQETHIGIHMEPKKQIL